MRALVIDDERLARRELISLLDKYENIEVVDECANVEEAKEAVNKHKPDLLFLDIQMPGKNGFDLISELDAVPTVIFVSAYDEFAIRAFEVNALDYLLKPVHPERLGDAIRKLEDDTESDNEDESNEKLTEDDQIFLKDGEKCWFVSLRDIRLFESEGNYVRVLFHESKPLILRSLNNLEKRLDPKVFFRANRKFIINLKWVSNIEPWFNGGLQVTLKDGEKVEISRRQAAKFKDLMSL